MTLNMCILCNIHFLLLTCTDIHGLLFQDDQLQRSLYIYISVFRIHMHDK